MKKTKLTKEQMIKLLLEGKTYNEIGNLAGISRQRVQQITAPPPEIKKYIYRKFNGICQKCQRYVSPRYAHIHHQNGQNTFIENYNAIENLILLCLSCHREAHGIDYIVFCKECGNPIKVRKKSLLLQKIFCSPECKNKYRQRNLYITLKCSYCHESFTREKWKYERAKRDYPNHGNMIFCSKKCQGKWFGEHYGCGRKKKSEGE